MLVMSVTGILRGFFQGKRTMVPTALSQLAEQVVNAVVSILSIGLMFKAFDSDEYYAAYGAAGGIMVTLAVAVTALLFFLFVFWLCRPKIHRHLR